MPATRERPLVDGASYAEQRLFSRSPLNTWLTAAALFAVLMALYAASAAIDGALAPDRTSWVAAVLTLILCSNLALQRFSRQRDLVDAPRYTEALSAGLAWEASFDGRRLRLVFGVEALQEGRAARDLPTNLTVIFEGEERLFATRGDDHCTVDELRQELYGLPAERYGEIDFAAHRHDLAPADLFVRPGLLLRKAYDTLAAYERAAQRALRQRALDHWRGAGSAGSKGWYDAGIPLPQRGKAKELMTATATATIGYSEGMLVEHEKYGRGRVTEVSGHGVVRKIRIRFAGGERSFIAALAKLTVVTGG